MHLYGKAPLWLSLFKFSGGYVKLNELLAVPMPCPAPVAGLEVGQSFPIYSFLLDRGDIAVRHANTKII